MDDGEKAILNVNLSGDYVEPDSLAVLRERLLGYNLACDLKIIQPQPIGFKEQRLAALKTDIISELYENSHRTIETKDDEIAVLKSEIKKLVQSQEASNLITKLAKTQYDIEEMAVDILVYSDGEKQDTIPTALVDWKSKLSGSKRKEQEIKLLELLKVQLNSENVRVIEIK